MRLVVIEKGFVWMLLSLAFFFALNLAKNFLAPVLHTFRIYLKALLLCFAPP